MNEELISADKYELDYSFRPQIFLAEFCPKIGNFSFKTWPKNVRGLNENSGLILMCKNQYCNRCKNFFGKI